MNIFIWTRLPDAAKRLIIDAAPHATLTFANRDGSDESDKLAFMQADVVFGDAPPGWLPETTTLRWMQLESVGFGQYSSVVQPNQTISNLRGFGKEVVSETVIAGILTLYRRLDKLAQLQAAKDWQQSRIRAEAKRLYGASVVILGAGAISSHLRSILEAFGCTVFQFAKQSPVELSSLEALDAQLPSTDIVIGCLPHTPHTAGMINAERLAKFKHGAILVNAGRGSLVEEAALVEALRSGALGGAVLDVTAAEPLPPDNPLWNCPNVILTQHTGGGYADEQMDKTRLFLSNLARYQKDEPVLNIVDFGRGY